MSFTEADYAKAIYMYDRYKYASWWPQRLVRDMELWFLRGLLIENDDAMCLIGTQMYDTLVDDGVRLRDYWSAMGAVPTKETTFCILADAMEWRSKHLQAIR